MATCSVCGNVLDADSKACSLCGTSTQDKADNEVSLETDDQWFDQALRWEGLEEDATPAPETPTLPQAIVLGPVTTAHPAPPPAGPVAIPVPVVPARRQCPSCGQVYGPEHTDPFCSCGLKLVVVCTPAPAAMPVAPGPQAAPAGKRCLVLYGPDRQPVHSFPLIKDVVLIGRQDPLRGHFPDVNLAEWLDEASARKISRKHALVLHTRATDTFTLRPLAGNTGTQIEQDMVEPLQDYPLRPGTRLILGGAARFKFEVQS
jgi:hypothetical protein